MALTNAIQDGVAGVSSSRDEPFRLRSYQAEMVEESMRTNIIVVMDTGSGKTHIAIERTRLELETCSPQQIVWFLAPTVTLCEQQHEIFKSNLPGCGIQLLSGKDDLEHWTKQSTWDAVLHNVRIVVSTHQVLLDALTHAFVRMTKLALLIFDEGMIIIAPYEAYVANLLIAHHCTLKHPARRIMSDFYTPWIQNNPGSRPKVLGLSASPVMRARATSRDLQEIEHNLHATAKTPKIHRSELVQYVHKPELVQINYPIEIYNYVDCRLLSELQRVYVEYDLMKDPYVVDLIKKQQDGHDTSGALQKVFMSRKTYCNEQLRALASKAKDMADELGTSAVDWYLHQCKAQSEKMVHISDQQLFDWSVNEKQHLLALLTELPFTESTLHAPISLRSLSRKVETLIDLLAAEAKHSLEFTGLVFVEQRVWVAVLAEILSVHPRTRDVFRLGTFVGTSQSSKRKANIASFAEPRNQQTTLEDFRAGTTNLILATSVLEEGIDVSSCNLVVCFERPKNLKSFVQRRGRARKQKSKYFIFTPEDGTRPADAWQSLEAEMKATYEDDMREVLLAEQREQLDEEGARYFRVQKTGALLTLDNASQHLHHFCALLGSGPYIDARPQFRFSQHGSKVSAEVLLPMSVDPTVRTHKSQELWSTERMARKDAAFEAYKALYAVGLVNDNLLPFRKGVEDQAAQYQIPDHTPALVEVHSLLDPWVEIARQQQQNPHAWHRTLLIAKTRGEEPIRMLLLTPIALPVVPEIPLYWNERKEYKVESSWLPGTILTHEEVETMRSITRKLLYSVFSGRMLEERQDFMWLIVPCGAHGEPLDHDALLAWNSLIDGNCPLSEHLTLIHTRASAHGLVRKQGDMRKYMLLPDAEGPAVLATRMPKRRDFLHKVLGSSGGNEAYEKAEPLIVSDCIMENLPVQYSLFALLFPSILHRIDVAMVAEVLRTTLLQPVRFDTSHLPIIISALTSSSTGEEEDYQRLELLGDCILKFIASVHLMAAHPKWPESFLTGEKGKIVSNGFLARATLAAGLDKFIITKRFTGAKWKPRYLGEMFTDLYPAEKVYRSSKLIADVVESLLGASYIVGGFIKAFSCIQTLLVQEEWTPIAQANSILYDAAPGDDTITSLSIVEALIGHSFSKRMLLVEALTHASYNGPNAHRSYERLEFLGDAVLDFIISRRLYDHKPELSHRTMHAMRSAMVNASFLAFSMFTTTVEEELTDKLTMRPVGHERALWQFLRSGGHQVVESRAVALEQHKRVQGRIATALQREARFPWHLLALTDADKFLSDIVESVLGAIYVDTHGDIAACEIFVRRLGILDCLERILRDNVDCLHPKERLGHLAIEKDVKYVRVTSDGNDSTGEKGVYRCQVKVGGSNVGGVVEGVKRLNAETIAAWQAVNILESDDKGVMQVSEEEDMFIDAEEGGGVMVEDW